MKHHHHRRRRRPTGLRLVVVIVCLVLGYAGILLGVKLIGGRLEGDQGTEAVGSLEGRFNTDQLTLNYAGRTWTYRQRGLTNILLIGVDWADIEQEHSSSRYDGQADTLLLMTLDKENKTVSTLQLDRDTMTSIRIYGPFGDYTGQQTAQICLSHAFGDSDAENCENTVWAVSKLLGGIPIEGYIALDMESIAVLNDALGGVTVTLEDDYSALDPAMTQGTTLTLHGKQAEYFVRSRLGIGAGTNISRMHRQKAFINTVGDMIVENMSQDLNFIGELFDRLSGHMVTDMERGWLINKSYESQNYERLEIRNIAGSHRIGEDGFMEFWADDDAIGSLLTDTFFE